MLLKAKVIDIKPNGISLDLMPDQSRFTYSSSVSRNREPLASLILYHAFKWSVVSPVFHTYLRGRIYGVEQVPKEGPLVVVSNHASDFDPPIVSNCVGRPVAFMAKDLEQRVCVRTGEE